MEDSSLTTESRNPTMLALLLAAQQLHNPYWDAVKSLPGEETLLEEGRWKPVQTTYDERNHRVLEHRETLTSQYAWSIPDPSSLAFVAYYLGSHAIELGAGTGYWAMLLDQLGVNIIAFDQRPPYLVGNNWYHSPSIPRNGPVAPERKLLHKKRDIFFNVRRGTPKMLTRTAYAHRTLFLCWPPHQQPMAAKSLKAYLGRRIVYIGPPRWTADPTFFEAIARDWREIASHCPESWYAIEDDIKVYERR